jgi:hypothetical protein
MGRVTTNVIDNLFSKAQPALATDAQGAQCESEKCGFPLSAKMKVGRRWGAAEAPSLGKIYEREGTLNE